MYLKLDHNIVIATSRNPQKNHDWIAYEGEIPTLTEGQHLEYVNGRVVAVENVSKEDLRRQAYERECDPLLPSIQSYELQGKTEQLEAVKAEWLARHKAIEERYPDEVAE